MIIIKIKREKKVVDERKIKISIVCRDIKSIEVIHLEKKHKKRPKKKS